MNRQLLIVLALLFPACASAPEAPPSAPAEAKVPTLARDLPTPSAEDTGADPTATPEDVAGPPADAQRTASGLATRVLRSGTGTVHPSERDKVRVHYSGWTTAGEMFDSSWKRGEPATFPVNGVIKGFSEGLQLMVSGERRRLWIPADLAYGESPKSGAPGGMLVFDVDLLGIEP